MTGILVVTHGNFGKALIESVEMIIGKQPNVEALGLMPEWILLILGKQY